MPLRFHPIAGQPIRFLPRHGNPTCVIEWASQETVKFAAIGLVYMALFASGALLALYLSVHPFGI